jgi:hypothetical protein
MIKQCFVANSSTSSFCMFALDISSDWLDKNKQLINEIRSKHPEIKNSYENMCDIEKDSEIISLIVEMECRGYFEDDRYIGYPAEKIPENITLSDLRKQMLEKFNSIGINVQSKNIQWYSEETADY